MDQKRKFVITIHVISQRRDQLQSKAILFIKLGSNTNLKTKMSMIFFIR